MKKSIIIPVLLIALISTNTKAFEEYISTPALTTVWVERPSDNFKLVEHISYKYGIQIEKAEEIVETAKIEADDVFPTHTDILAVVAIESKFKQFARAKGSKAKGLMQILYKPTSYEIDKNIADGTDLLKKYNEILHSRDASIQAYNLGIGTYLSGGRNKSYLTKFKQAKQQLESTEV